MKSFVRTSLRHILCSLFLCAAFAAPSHAQTLTVLHSFQVPPTNLSGGLTLGPDGQLYGTTQTGGANGSGNFGTIFSLSTSGSFSVLYAYPGLPGADSPVGGVCVGPGGVLVATSELGNVNGSILGITTGSSVVFQNQISNVTVSELQGVIFASDGNYYGLAIYGGQSSGFAYRLAPDGTFTLLHQFTGFADGAYPSGKLVEGPDHNLYGVTQGGALQYGTVFRLTTSGSLTTLHAFTSGTDGQSPSVGLAVGDDGNLWGVTALGGSHSGGVIFTTSTSGVYTIKAQGSSTNPVLDTPSGPLINGGDGYLYGVSRSGGAYGQGNLYRVDLSGNCSTVASLGSQPNDPFSPIGSIARTPDGTFYGASQFGGTGNLGAIFAVTSGSLNVLYSFGVTKDGYSPTGQLVTGTDGALYGVTKLGGAFGQGTVFRATASGDFETLYSFTGNPVYLNPQPFLTSGSDGLLYGDTRNGGIYRNGTIFKISTSGSFTAINQLDGSFGKNPSDALTQGLDGSFYGMSEASYNSPATIFNVTSSGSGTELYSFPTSDLSPAGPLAQGSDGTLYGVMGFGGPYSNGYAYSFTLSGSFTDLFDFGTTSTAGVTPGGGLYLAPSGNLYGVTSYGGANSAGTVYIIPLSGSATYTVDFPAGDAEDVQYPSGRLASGQDGSLYGVASSGGSSDAGGVFQLTTSGSLRTVYSFDSYGDGNNPGGGLISGTDGAFYGDNTGGGNGGPYLSMYGGTIYRISFAPVVATGSAYISGTSAQVGSVNSSRVDTSVVVVYGTSAASYSGTLSAVDIGDGTDSVPAGTLTGLLPDTTYHYRVIATNAFGTVTSNDETFTTLPAPLFPAPVTASAIKQDSAVLNGVVNPHGIDTSAYFIYGPSPSLSSTTASVEIGSGGGSVACTVPVTGLTPGTRYGFQIVTTSAAGTFFGPQSTFETRSMNATGQLLALSGSSVPGAGTGGVPVGALWKQFGPPAIDQAGGIAFRGEWRAGRTSGAGIMESGTALAVLGQPVPQLSGTIYKTLGDPTLDLSGNLGFLASVGPQSGKGAAIPAVFTTVSGTLAPVALGESIAPGTGGAKFRSFQDVATSGSSFAILATLASGTGSPKITGADAKGIWISGSGSTLQLALREGQAVGSGTIKTLTAFIPGIETPGAGRGWLVTSSTSGTPGVIALAGFTDKTLGIVCADNFGHATIITRGSVANGPGSPTTPGATFATYGVPAAAANGAVIFPGTLTASPTTPKTAAAGLFRYDPRTQRCSIIERESEIIPNGSVFARIPDVAVAADGSGIAFPATISGTGAKGASALTLWQQSGSSSINLIARGGAPATPRQIVPDAPTGAEWAAFKSLAVQGGAASPGALFSATLTPGKGGVTPATSTGLWGVSSPGPLRLLVRAGVTTAGGKTVKTFTCLSAVAGSEGVSRWLNNNGQIVWLATFTDGTQGVVVTQIP